MKLFLCPACHDVQKLQRNRRTCPCGASGGWYHVGGVNATYVGRAIPLGFANSSLVEALRSRPAEGEGSRFTAFVIPFFAPTVLQLEE